MLTDYFKVEETNATANFEKLSEHHMQLTLASSLNIHVTSWVNARLTGNLPDINGSLTKINIQLNIQSERLH